MKENDLNVISSMAAILLDAQEYSIVEAIGREKAIFCVTAIYCTNDVCKGYGQDFYPNDALNENDGYKKVSVISFENGVSVIVSGHSSRYQDNFPLCGYSDLHDDIYSIVIAIQAVFDRLSAKE